MSDTKDGLPSTEWDRRFVRVLMELSDLIGERLVEEDEKHEADPTYVESVLVSDLSGTLAALDEAWKADQIARAVDSKQWAEVIPFRRPEAPPDAG